MEAEAKPFVDHLGLEPIDDFFPSNTPFHAYGGIHNGTQVTVIMNGKDTVYGTGVDNCGTVPASLATFLALQRLPTTDLFINAGTCGGFQRKGATIGDVFITTAVANHDRRIPIPPFIPYGIGKIESIVSKTTQFDDLISQNNFKLGICTTGNSLDKTAEDDTHMEANDASVKDMEAAAIAWCCSMFDKPFLGVKVVTDIVDGDKPTQDEFMENLHTASVRLQQALPIILDYVCGKEL
jgi:5'-methylthioadenosine nucleosidase